MGRDVIECLGKVMCPRNNTVLTDHNGTNGNFALFEGLLCLSQGLVHVKFFNLKVEVWHTIVFFFFHVAKVRKKNRNFAM